MKRMIIDSEYREGRYHLLGFRSGMGRLPRRRWFDSYAGMVAAVERVNPGYEIDS